MDRGTWLAVLHGATKPHRHNGVTNTHKLLLTMTVSHSFFVFDDLDSFEEYKLAFCRMRFSWGFCNVLLMIRLGLYNLRKKITKCYPLHIRSAQYQYALTNLNDANRSPQLRLRLSHSPALKFYSLPLVSILYSLEGNQCAEPTLEE